MPLKPSVSPNLDPSYYLIQIPMPSVFATPKLASIFDQNLYAMDSLIRTLTASKTEKYTHNNFSSLSTSSHFSSTTVFRLLHNSQLIFNCAMCEPERVLSG